MRISHNNHTPVYGVCRNDIIIHHLRGDLQIIWSRAHLPTYYEACTL